MVSTSQAGAQIIYHLIWDIYESERGSINNVTGTGMKETILGQDPECALNVTGKPAVCLK